MSEDMNTETKSFEVVQQHPEIAVATGTFYPNWNQENPEGEITSDNLRGDLAVQSIDSAINQGFSVSVVDGGSSDSFIQLLKARKINFETQAVQGGQGPARRQALEMAERGSGVKVICQTEPEKVSIVADCLQIAAQPILRGEADIVVPKRKLESFATYPEHQARQEQNANALYNKILRSRGLLQDGEPDIDFWIGVRVFANQPEVTDLFKGQEKFSPNQNPVQQKVRVDMYSNPLFYPIVEALYRGLRVKSVVVPYVHPKAQTELEAGNEEFDRKRDTQRRTIVTELIHLVRKKEDSPKSRLQGTSLPKTSDHQK